MEEDMASPETGTVLEHPEQLGEWLKSRGRDVSVALAVRASLRVLPLIFEYPGFLQGEAVWIQTVLQIIRVNFVSWAAAREQTYPGRLRPADTGANASRKIFGSEAIVGLVAVLAENAAGSNSYVTDVERAIEAALEASRHHAGYRALDDVWNAIASDARGRFKPSELLRQPLWFAE